MEKISIIQSTAVLVPIANIDTDQIIPARFLKTTSRDGFGEKVFYDWRFNPDGTPAANILDGQSGSILVAGENFGCGSSREHAPIAIKASGISCVIAESFARIFFRNSINIGLPILECPEAAKAINNGDTVSVNFDNGVITNETSGESYQATAFPQFMQELINAGGLVKYIANKGDK